MESTTLAQSPSHSVDSARKKILPPDTPNTFRLLQRMVDDQLPHPNPNDSHDATFTYKQGYHPSVLRSHTSRTVHNSAAYLIPHFRPGAHVLDVGCGPGTITTSIARLVPGGHVTGVDYVPHDNDSGSDGEEKKDKEKENVLARARAHAVREGVSNVAFAHGDACDLASFADGSFDVVHCHQVLQHLRDPVRALREMRRVARGKTGSPGAGEEGEEGGIVAAREADAGTFVWSPPSPVLDEWLSLYRAVARANGSEPDGGRHLVAWALEAGFARDAITATAGTWCMSTPEERAGLAGMWADRIVNSAFATRALELGLADRGTLERVAAGWREWATKEDGWFAMLHGEIICRV